MELTAERLKELFDDDPADTSKTLAGSLRDFGYAITDGWVETEMKRLYAGGEPLGGPSMFLARWIKDGID